MNEMTIGRLAKQAAVKHETVRYYEKRGLMPKPEKNASGYRLYSERDLARLQFIKRSQSLGFTLKEIDELLSLQGSDSATCQQVRNFTAEKLSDIEQRINELKRMKKALTSLAKSCTAEGPTTECPIIDAIESMSDDNE